jgi:hypothetical protein
MLGGGGLKDASWGREHMSKNRLAAGSGVASASELRLV